jgi:hypothetical protein
LLDGLPLVKMTALHQRALDLHAAIPSFNDLQEVRLAKIGHANRIGDLTRLKAEGGFGLDEHAPQVSVERKKRERAEQELARLTSLQEIRTSKWNSASRLDQAVSDWLLRAGVPQGCQIESVEDAPLSELLKKGETIANAVERFRHRRRELAANQHRVRSSPWPSSLAKIAAKQLIDRLADAGMPNLDAAIEHGMDIGFATTRLQSLVYNAQPGAVAQNQAQREEAEAQINSDMLIAERSECALIWAAETLSNEILNFRADTTPSAAIGVSLRTVPRAQRTINIDICLRHRSRRAMNEMRVLPLGSCQLLGDGCAAAGMGLSRQSVLVATSIRNRAVGNLHAARRRSGYPTATELPSRRAEVFCLAHGISACLHRERNTHGQQLSHR